MLNRILDLVTRSIPTAHDGAGHFHAGPRGPYVCCDETCRQPGSPDPR